MAKRELIEALESLDCGDGTIVSLATEGVHFHFNKVELLLEEDEEPMVELL